MAEAHIKSDKILWVMYLCLRTTGEDIRVAIIKIGGLGRYYGASCIHLQVISSLIASSSHSHQLSVKGLGHRGTARLCDGYLLDILACPVILPRFKQPAPVLALFFQ